MVVCVHQRAAHPSTEHRDTLYIETIRSFYPIHLSSSSELPRMTFFFPPSPLPIESDLLLAAHCRYLTTELAHNSCSAAQPMESIFQRVNFCYSFLSYSTPHAPCTPDFRGRSPAEEMAHHSWSFYVGTGTQPIPEEGRTFPGALCRGTGTCSLTAASPGS